MSKIKIALTGSGDGNPWNDSLKNSIENQGAESVRADFREIVPLKNVSDTILTDPKEYDTVYNAAKEKAEAFLADKDALLLSGNGFMVNPRLYGEKQRDNEEYDVARSIAEFALIDIATKKGMPILGICGGHQILNVFHGGKIKPLSRKEETQQGIYENAPVIVDTKSELGQIINRDSPDNSQARERLYGAHHQVVKEIGGRGAINSDKEGKGGEDYLKIVARATDSGKNVEAVESLYGAPVIGLQFHPELNATGLPEIEKVYDSNNVAKKAIVYSPEAESHEHQLKNTNIFSALHKSAEAYHAKQNVMEEIKFLGARDDHVILPSQLKEKHRYNKPVEQETVVISKETEEKINNFTNLYIKDVFVKKIQNKKQVTASDVKEYMDKVLTILVDDKIINNSQTAIIKNNYSYKKSIRDTADLLKLEIPEVTVKDKIYHKLSQLFKECKLDTISKFFEKKVTPLSSIALTKIENAIKKIAMPSQSIISASKSTKISPTKTTKDNKVLTTRF